MGPRARRRLSIALVAGITAVLVIAGVKMVGGSSPHRATLGFTGATPASRRYLANRLKLAFGMKPGRVRRLVGRPVKVDRDCWQYPPYQYTARNGTVVTTADRLCFAYGVYNKNEFWQNGQWEVLTAKGPAPAS